MEKHLHAVLMQTLVPQKTIIHVQYIVLLFKATNPASTELEIVMLDWLGKMLQLPEAFIAGTHGQGGGVIQVSVSV